MSSTSLSRSPSSSAAMSAVRRSSLGLSRFHAMTSLMYALMLSIASNEARISSRVRIGSNVFTTAPDHSRSCERSRPSGMPSISEITMNGQREREVGDEVDVGAGRRARRRGARRRVAARAGAAPRRAGREHLRDEPAQPVMVGRVEVEHVVAAAVAAAPRASPRCRDRRRDRERRHVPLLDAEARVAQHAVHVVVAEEGEGADRAEVHRVLLAHQPVLRVRVFEEAGLERVEHHRQVAGIGRFARRHERDRTPVAAAGRDVTSVTPGTGAGLRTSCRSTATSGRLRDRDSGRRAGDSGDTQPRGDRRRAARVLRGRRLAAERAPRSRRAPGCRPGRCTTTSPTWKRCGPRSRSGSSNGSRR